MTVKVFIGISDAFVSFGASSVHALGNHPKGRDWKLACPDQLGDALFTINNLLTEES